MLTTIQLWIYTIFKFIMEKLGRYRIINDRIDSKPYLERYYIFLRNRTWFPFNIFIHKFLQSDPDDLHDHPWGFTTFILYGGYWEHTQSGMYWRGPMFCQTVKATHIHRVELEPRKPVCWTLFISYRKERDWGFYKKGQWIQHEQYFRDKIQYTEA